MWIRDVDVPEAVIDAHRKGNLVIFVGAGASMGAPASLPSFRALADAIAADGSIQATEDQLAQPDVFLGELLDDHEIDVHLRAATRVGVPTSTPNALHEAIAALAIAGAEVRVVTTNYDRHLSSVFEQLGADIPEFHAPALPMGDDFAGLVYLHGSLIQPPSALVVTDKDFGRAYLRDAWAARFLERMFASYTVLFVGYSHTDVVMSYLGRALGASHERFALTDRPAEPQWKRLRIQPVEYLNGDGSHQALPETIGGWAAWASMGLLEHRQRVSQLLSGPPSQVPEDESYLASVVADSQQVTLFTEQARDETWLRWAARQSEVRTLFDPKALPTDCTNPLAYWFAEHFVMQETLTEVALGVVLEAGGQLSPPLWSAIGHHLHMSKGPRPPWLSPWIVLLLQTDPGWISDWLEFALMASLWPDDRATAVLLFDHLTEPRARLRPSLGNGATISIDVRGSTHWLKDAWRDFFTPKLGELCEEILVIAERHLRHACRLLRVAGSSTQDWDPLSFGRSAIEAHPQDSLDDPVDILIDAARDCLDNLIANNPAEAARVLERWAAADEAILRRLALYGWARRTDVDATSKLTWLRQSGWMWAHQLRHEVFGLIERTIAAADESVGNAVVDDIVTWTGDPEYRDYEVFNALSWIARHAPNLTSVTGPLAKVKEGNPEFTEREYPDLLSWSDSGTIGPQPPMTTAELYELVKTDVISAVQELRKYEDVSSPFAGPTWHDALTVLTQLIRDEPQVGFAILAAGADNADLVRAVVDGWSSARLETSTAEQVCVALVDANLATVASHVARMLNDGGQRESHPTEWFRLSCARDLALKLWGDLPTTEINPSEKDWLGRAISHPAGALAQFWVQAVALDWREAADDWTGLPTSLSAALEVMLSNTGPAGELAQVVVASQLHFFWAADRDWCEKHVLPLLDWTYVPRSRRAWDGFLRWGRWNDSLLGAGLMASYLETAQRIGTFGDELQRDLSQHLANIAVFSNENPDWMRTFTATVDASVRVEWISQVGWQLAKLPTDAADAQWERWMRSYWQGRLQSIPSVPTKDEASALTIWVATLGDAFAEGVALATSTPAGLVQQSNLLYDLAKRDVLPHPHELARLLAHVLRGSGPPFYGCGFLATIVAKLRAQDVDVAPIAEEATRLACTDVANW